MIGQSQPQIGSRALNLEGRKQLFGSRIRRAASFVLACTAIVGLALHAAAADQVPFKGRADAVVTGVSVEPDGVHLTATATGNATQLGAFTREEQTVVHADGTLVGSLTLTAANGDQLFVEFVGAFTSDTTAEGTYTITGGTGRFTNATGEAVFVVVTSDGIHFAVTFDGTISSTGGGH